MSAGRRFLLADPSLSHLGGHYLEYLNRVLPSVERAGYRALIGCNAALDDAGVVNPNWPVYPVFQFDIWGGRPGANATVLEKSDRASRRMLRRRFSRLADIWTLAADPAVAAHYLARGGMTASACRRLQRAHRVRQIVDALNAAEPQSTSDLSVEAAKERLWNQARVALRLLATAGDGATPLPAPSPPDFARIERATNAAQTFASGLAQISAAESIGRGDIVFLPTMAWHDLRGLEMFLRAAPDRDDLPVFCCLFRRDLFRGYPDSHAGQDFDVHEMRVLFSKLKALAFARVLVLTDTEELSDQYGQLVAPVVTMPVPSVPVDAAPEKASGEPIIFGYLGDARREKGFHYLPGLVSALAGAGNDVPPFKLLSQAYTPKGPADVSMLEAVEKLRLRSPRYVDLAEGAIGSQDYMRLLQAMDVVLIPYQRDNYIARSSGVFMESVCAQRPAIVTAGTWMARLIDSASHDYHVTMTPSSAVMAQFHAGGLNWRRRKASGVEEAYPLSEDGGLPISGANWPNCTLQRAGATHLWITFRPSEHGAGLFTNVFVAQQDAADQPLDEALYCVGGRHHGLFSIMVKFLPGAKAAWLSFGCAHGARDFELKDLSLRLVKSPHEIARAAGGLTFVEPYDKGDKELVRVAREMLRDFVAVKESVSFLSTSLMQVHTGEALVEQLLEHANRLEVVS